MTLGSLYSEAQGYVPVLLENLRDVSCSGTCWLLDGAWFQCRYGGFWMSSYRLMFPGVRSSLVFSGFGLKPPASGFQSYSYSSLKTSPLDRWLITKDITQEQHLGGVHRTGSERRGLFPGCHCLPSVFTLMYIIQQMRIKGSD